MMGTESKANAKIIELHPKAQDSQASDKKWGKAVMKLGFSMVPSLIFRAQQRLGLNSNQLAILLQLADFWWDNDRKPYPSKQALSERLGIGTRQIQRYIAELEKAGLLKRIVRTGQHNANLSNEYDLGGLVKRLKELEPEFREVREMNRQVKKKGGLRQKVQHPAVKKD